MPPRFSLGLDLGQAADFTALAIAELRSEPGPEVEPDPTAERRFTVAMAPATRAAVISRVPATRPKLITHYELRHLQRYPLGTPYPAIVADLAALLAKPELAVSGRGDVLLAIDATGVGRPVVDMIRAERLPVHLSAITITGGDVVSKEGDMWRVPKRDLIGGLVVLLQHGRLKVAMALPMAQTLVTELLNMRLAISKAGHDSYGAWREGQHDDLALAVALACWRGEHPPAKVKIF